MLLRVRLLDHRVKVFLVVLVRKLGGGVFNLVDNLLKAFL